MTKHKEKLIKNDRNYKWKQTIMMFLQSSARKGFAMIDGKIPKCGIEP